MTRAGSQAVAVSAGEAVLGLLVERPGSSRELERRLEERLSSARFARGTAHQAVRRLARDGLIRIVDGSSASGRTGLSVGAEAGSVGEVSYEATAAGVAYFEQWLESSMGMPPLREELHVKIAFCGPEDLPRAALRRSLRRSM